MKSPNLPAKISPSGLSLCIININPGCRLIILYVKGMVITIADGGADSERRARRLMKEARRVRGRCLDQN